MTSIRENSNKRDGFERERCVFFNAKNLSEFCLGIAKMYSEAEKFFILSNLHPVPTLTSSHLELRYLSKFFDKQNEFKDFLIVSRTNKEFAQYFRIEESCVLLFLYRLEKIGILLAKKIGRFKAYTWKSDVINREALVQEFGQLLNFLPRDNSIWDARTKEALAKNFDEDPDVERFAQKLFAEILAACIQGEASRDARDRLLNNFSGELKSKLDIRVWQLQVRHIHGGIMVQQGPCTIG